MLSKDGKLGFRRYVVDEQRSLLELLHDFPSARPPLGDFLQTVPRLQARLYTISSSPLAHPRHAHVTVSVVEEPRPRGQVHRGVASTYLASLRAAVADVAPAEIGTDPTSNKAASSLVQRSAPSMALVTLKRSTFPQPPPGAALVLVGAGTGIAPLRAFWQQRKVQKDRGARGPTRSAPGVSLIRPTALPPAPGYELGPTYLIFGCRRAEEDFVYRREVEQMQREGVLTDVFTAFSRDGPSKVYVQHRVKEHGDVVHSVLRAQRGYFFVCGCERAGGWVGAPTHTHGCPYAHPALSLSSALSPLSAEGLRWGMTCSRRWRRWSRSARVAPRRTRAAWSGRCSDRIGTWRSCGRSARGAPGRPDLNI